MAPSVIRELLVELGMTGGISQRDSALYLPGLEFMTLISFLGCSPSVSMAVASDDQAPNPYFIEITDCGDAVVAICGALRRAPRCPQCKRVATDWNDAFATANTGLFCAHCGFRSPLPGWDWRHQTGFGRQWINIWGVHEGEAVPGEKLLESLHKLSGVVWDYAWCRP